MVLAIPHHLFENELMRIHKKHRPVIIFVSIALLLVIVRAIYVAHEMREWNAGAPFTKQEQQALIAEQQEDEKTDVGPLKAKMSVSDAERAVLNLQSAK